MDNDYEKVELPIEATDFSPGKPDFKWFGIMMGVIIGFFAFSYLCFHLFANIIVANISIEQERKIFGDSLIDGLGVEKIESYYTFQNNIAEFEKYNILVSDDTEANAYAILGANIVVTKSLIDNIEYEEELQFVIAHEIGHIKTRDNLKILARDLPFKITLFFIGFDINLGFTNFSNLALKSFSRETELDADENAIIIMKDNNINPYCASKFFERIPEFPLEIMSSHPNNENRIKNIKDNYLGEKNFDKCKKVIKK